MNIGQAWLREGLILLILLAWSAAIGAWLEKPIAISLQIAAVFYCLWHALQMWRFHLWLSDEDKYRVPFYFGLWQAAIDGVNKLRRSKRKRERRLVQMLESFDESTNALPDATLVIDDSGQIEWINRAATRLLGVTQRHVGKRAITKVIDTSRFRKYLTEQDYRIPIKLLSPLDQSVMLELRVVPYGVGKRLLQLRDISRLEQLETVRQDFVANVSHEMKTPLTVIHGYLETMLDSEMATDDEKGSQWRPVLAQMNAQSERLQRIVDDLLLLSRLEQGSVKTEQVLVQIAPMLEQVVEEARALSGERSHGLSLEADSSLQLRGNSDELQSLFSNLVFNAVNYTPARGNIEIRWQAEGDYAVFSVADNGIGIEEQHIPRLTERFYRVDAGRSRKSGGTGLGLAIVKHVLNRHSGRLSITSRYGEGSIFTCRFPLVD